MLAEARALAYAASNTDPAIEAEMLVIEATAARVPGNGERRIEALERARHRLRGMSLPLNRRTNDLLLRVLLHPADAYVESENTSATERYLAPAQEVLERAPATRPQLRFWYLGDRAQLALFRGELLRGVEAMSDGLAIARDNGLIRSMMKGSHFLARAFFEGRQTALARKHPHNAIVLIVEALKHATRPYEALQLLDKTAVEFRRQGFHRFLRKAEHIRSGLYAKLNRVGDAYQAIDHAVQFLENYGSSYELGAAYELSGRLTDNRVHTKRGREIRAHLTLPARP